MNTLSKVLISAVVTVSAASAMAQAGNEPKLYGEIAYNLTNLKADDTVDTIKAKPAVATGIVGYKFHPNLAVEGMLGLGLSGDKVELNGQPTAVDAKISSAFGVFVRPSVKLGESVELFARLGYVQSKLKLSVPGLSLSDSDGGAAYGLGGNFYLSKQSYLQLSWTNYYKKDGVKIDGIGLGFGFRF